MFFSRAEVVTNWTLVAGLNFTTTDQMLRPIRTSTSLQLSSFRSASKFSTPSLLSFNFHSLRWILDGQAAENPYNDRPLIPLRLLPSQVTLVSLAAFTPSTTISPGFAIDCDESIR